MTLWTAVPQVPLSVEFSRLEILEWVAISSPGDHLDPGIKPTSLASLALQSDSLPLVPLGESDMTRVLKNNSVNTNWGRRFSLLLLCQHELCGCFFLFLSFYHVRIVIIASKQGDQGFPFPSFSLFERLNRTLGQ